MSSTDARSCRDCPSFLAADEVAGFFGKSVGAPMCARYGKVLGGGGILPIAEKPIHEKIAKGCSGYGQARPDAPQEYLQTTVALPDPQVLKNKKKDDNADLVNTCLQCPFFTDQEKVAEKFGWSGGMCGATGRLLLPNRLSKEAGMCEDKMSRSAVNVTADVSRMHLIPMYAEAKAYDPSPLGRFKKMRENGSFVDPVDYESDAPVTDDDIESGIRAWRKIEDPNGTGNSVFLPIFDIDKFDVVEKAKVPRTGDDESPEDYIDPSDLVYSVAVEWMELDETPFLWGQPGVGKTELLRHMAWLMCAPFDRISITREMEVEDLIGKMVFRDNETSFQWGRLPHRWVKPGVLCLDEINAGPDAVWQRCRPLFDNAKQLVLDEAGAEKVTRDPFCFVGLTGNPAWDIRNVGVSELADADTNRLAHVMMHLPPRDVEKTILQVRVEKDGWTPTEEMLNTVLDLSEEIRGLSEEGSLPVTWGIRQNIKVIRHLKWFSWPVAYRRAVTDVLDPSVADMVLDLVRTKVGDGQ